MFCRVPLIDFTVHTPQVIREVSNGKKVYKLAQEFKVSSEALVQMLRGMGIPVKSHMSTVDESLRNEIKRNSNERAEIKKSMNAKNRCHQSPRGLDR